MTKFFVDSGKKNIFMIFPNFSFNFLFELLWRRGIAVVDVLAITRIAHLARFLSSISLLNFRLAHFFAPSCPFFDWSLVNNCALFTFVLCLFTVWLICEEKQSLMYIYGLISLGFVDSICENYFLNICDILLCGFMDFFHMDTLIIFTVISFLRMTSTKI